MQIKDRLEYTLSSPDNASEIDSVVGKLGRAETPLDPAPVSMIAYLFW